MVHRFLSFIIGCSLLFPSVALAASSADRAAVSAIVRAQYQLAVQEVRVINANTSLTPLQKHNAISAVLKTRHDAAMAAIQNIR